MVILPDGASIEMQWKQVKYYNRKDYIIFDIIPMFNLPDLIIIPSKDNWKEIQSTFFLTKEKRSYFF